MDSSGAQGAEEISSDASHRRYRRVWLDGGRSVVEVRYPPGRGEELRRDLDINDWLRKHAIEVPETLEASSDRPVALLRDFGRDDAAATLLSLPISDRLRAIERLLRPLAALARLDPGELPRWNAPLDAPRLRWELAGFELWYVRYALGRRPPRDVSLWLDGLADRVGGHPVRVCHRDYHLNNLFLTGDSVGVIDAQDVRLGPDTYDLASLLDERDAPGLLAAADRRAVVDRWAELTGPFDGWRDRLAEASAQRGLKVIGTFARLLAGGRRRYGPWLEVSLEQTAETLRQLGAPSMLVRWCGKEAL